jgi:hypothetical protein
VNAFPSGKLWPTGKALALKDGAHTHRGINNTLPFHAFTRIKINHKRVGALDVVDRRIPGVQFNDADRNQTKQAVETVNP